MTPNVQSGTLDSGTLQQSIQHNVKVGLKLLASCTIACERRHHPGSKCASRSPEVVGKHLALILQNPVLNNSDCNPSMKKPSCRCLCHRDRPCCQGLHCQGLGLWVMFPTNGINILRDRYMRLQRGPQFCASPPCPFLVGPHFAFLESDGISET